MEKPNLQFVLKGFTEVTGVRMFAFDGVASDRSRTPFTVSANLAMSRRYGIRLQELPLLCRAVLEDHAGEPATEWTYGEQEMSLHAGRVAAREEAARQRRPPRQPASQNLGAAWRAPQR
ncbi:MAG: hypothetical protein R2762_15760 [Bryobacteraceae bacterium]